MGCKIHTPHFILLLAENSSLRCRLGLTVSRKVGNAVMRNRVKRNVREFFRREQSKFTNVVDFSVVAKRGAADLSHKDIFAELQNALEAKGHLNG
ncbi:ribonuclease P protein component [Malonomonas rubra DSM 5091]|uniref:Ribonuclease P protein component n=2 Tax=Malonomonas rubra TaxID=57040 RepID=A0A1M6JUI6_MALRU|nr:ribonuclease P protein component [Malonomonas rubra DSM 5091]